MAFPAPFFTPKSTIFSTLKGSEGRNRRKSWDLWAFELSKKDDRIIEAKYAVRGAVPTRAGELQAQSLGRKGM